MLPSDLCASVARDASAIRKDVELQASRGIVRIEKVTHPGHGMRLRVSTPARLAFEARTFEEATP